MKSKPLHFVVPGVLLVLFLLISETPAACSTMGRKGAGDRKCFHPGGVSPFIEFGSEEGSEEYKRLEEELDALLRELRRLERDVRDKLNQELIPLIRREIEKLHERLRNFRFKKQPPEERPKDDDMIRTQRIPLDPGYPGIEASALKGLPSDLSESPEGILQGIFPNLSWAVLPAGHEPQGTLFLRR